MENSPSLATDYFVFERFNGEVINMIAVIMNPMPTGNPLVPSAKLLTSPSTSDMIPSATKIHVG
ncbi:MAG: hypothetical protein B7Y43_14630 [Sphingomonas sp. 28-62-20]|nr:MAG: hypothetical protein B7Y43_14630 [Sphingomonas sp. 28-62-20]